MKNKALHRSATSILRSLQDRHQMWENNIGTMQFTNQDPETRLHFYDAIDAMKKFVDNIS